MACLGGTLYGLTEALILVVALSLDAFAASFAYGTDRIKIPFSSMMVINGICAGMLAASLFLGTMVRAAIPDGVTSVLCFAILLVLGTEKLCDSAVKAYIRSGRTVRKKLSFSFLNLNFILRVYADPETADSDASKTLNPREAASLAVALSLDGLAVGLGAAMSNADSIQIVLLSLITDAAAVMGGSWIGNRLSRKTSLNLSWLSGLLLIVLAFLKLL